MFIALIMDPLEKYISNKKEKKAYFAYSFQNQRILVNIIFKLFEDSDLIHENNFIEKICKRVEFDLYLICNKFILYEKNNEKNQWVEISEKNQKGMIEDLFKLMISPFFRRISLRSQSVPTLARKIADSKVLESAQLLVENFDIIDTERIFHKFLLLVSDISREVPNLIERFIDIGLMKAILER